MTPNTSNQILSLDDASVGMSLAEPVLGSQGEVVLSQGITLTEVLLNALRRRGVMSLSVLAPDAQPSTEARVGVDIKVHLARLERLFRQDAGQSGAAHLRALVTQYRMETTP